jgi:hypothetical protein
MRESFEVQLESTSIYHRIGCHNSSIRQSQKSTYCGSYLLYADDLVLVACILTARISNGIACFMVLEVFLTCFTLVIHHILAFYECACSEFFQVERTAECMVQPETKVCSANYSFWGKR